MFVTKIGSEVPNLQIISLPEPAHHALQGLIHLARRPNGEACLALDAARARRLPAGALAKTFQRLARRGILTAQRGPGGGYRLSRGPEKISAAEIVAAAVDERRERGCMMRSAFCDRRNPCAMHESVLRAARILRERLESMTLKDLCEMDDGGKR